MSENELKRRLTPMDAFFLYAETETAPMQVGGTCIFEGKLSFPRFRMHLAARLHQVPRYRQRAVFVPLNVSHPTWEDDPDFDIDNHLFRVRLDRPGTEEQLQQLSGEIFTGMLDRNKPLWEMYLVEGLSGNRTALILKVHHCMVDGVAGIGLAYTFLDVTPALPEKTRKIPFKPKPLPDVKARIYDAVWDNMVDSVVHWVRFSANITDFSARVNGTGVKHALGKFAGTLGGFLMPLKKMPFNSPFSGERLHAWREYKDSDIRIIRAVSGATVNDVVLAALALATRKYLEDHPEVDVSAFTSLRTLVPVNVRRERERSALGNRISFLPIELPLNISDAIELLHAIHGQMREHKAFRVADSISLMFDALQGTSVAAQATLLGTLANPVARQILGPAVEISPANLICTNVPGPQIPLYALGHRLMAVHGVVPTCLGMGINCCVVSYDQKVSVSIVGDGMAAGDGVAQIMANYDGKFQELLAAARIKGDKYVEIRNVLQHEQYSPWEGSIRTQTPKKPAKRTHDRMVVASSVSETVPLQS